jgi:hypothetical protein
MTSKTTLNAKNLAALGADRLADLVLELAKGNAGAKRCLRLELASEAGLGDVAREIRSWSKEGQIVTRENITVGFTNLPDAFRSLFFGKEQGRRLVAVEEAVAD